MKKMFTISFIAAITTFGLFAFMAYLISQDQPNIVESIPTIPFEVMQTPEESKVIEKPPLVLTPPEAPKLPPKAAPLEAEPSADVALDISIPTLNVGVKLGLGDMQGPPDTDARPIFRVTPKYPLAAASKGIEGWVVLSFNINEIGETTNISIVDAEPKRIFDNAAKRALQKWKYQAKVINGKAVSQQDLTVRLDFNMDQQI